MQTPDVVALAGERQPRSTESEKQLWPPAGALDLVAAIDRHAHERPDHVAFATRGERLSYRDLVARSDALAVHVTRTVPPGVPVVTLGHKQPDLLACFLACAKSGHAYIPVDDGLPAARVRRILENSGASLVLAPGEARLAAGHPNVLDGPALRRVIDGHRGVRLSDRVALGPHDNFYIMYTSGSTGEPKGVQITLANLSSFVTWALARHPIGGGRRFLNQASFGFDVSVMDLYLSLVTGGTVHAVDRGHLENPAELREALAAADPEVWVSTPSFGEMCLTDRSFRRDRLPSLQTFLFAGEKLAPSFVRRLHQRFPGARVYDLYGPTEATVVVTSLLVDEAVLARYPTLPLGAPPPGTRLLVVDPSGEPVPEGAPGEILIEGPSVSPGYVRDPALTDRVFSGAPPKRRYRTGDAGHVADGRIFFDGRFDSQIKLLGHRIELGDVAANLELLPAVAQAAALPVLRGGRCEAIIGVVVLHEGATATAAGLRADLARLVPRYMVPGEIRFRAVLPMTVNGKLDRARLAAEVEAERATASDERSNPPADRWKPEAGAQRLAALVAEILTRAKVGVHDPISGLGMNSLQVARLLGKIRDDLGVELTFSQVFEAQTAARLADLLAQAPTATGPRLRRRLDASRVPLSSVQFPYWFEYQMEPNSRRADIHLGLRFSGPLDTTRLQRALDGVFQRHDVLRVTFSMDREGARQVSAPRDRQRFALSVVDLKSVAKAAQAEGFSAEIARAAGVPMDLLRGPVIHATLLALAEQDHFLLIVIHHVAADGLSLGVLVKDLAALYRSLTADEAAGLPALPVQYGDFALWEAERLRLDQRRRQEAFWRRQLAPPVPEFVFPALGKGPAGAVRKHRVRLPLSERRSLEALATEEHGSLFMVLLTGVKVLLAQQTGQADLIVGVVAANRPEPALLELIGPFADVLPIRTSLDGASTFRSVLDRVRRSLLAAFDHPDFRFHELLRLVRASPGASNAQLCRVMLNLVEAIPDEDLGGLGLHAEEGLDEYEVAGLDTDESSAATRAVPSAAAGLALVRAGPAPRALYFTGLLDDAGLELELTADASLFTGSMVRALVEGLSDLLVQGASAPDVPLGKPAARLL